MLPRPLAAIPGASAATRKNGARTLLANILSNAARSNSAVGPNTAIPALLIRMSTSPTSSRQAQHVRGVGEVGGDEARLAAGGGDLLDRLGAAGGVASMDEDLGAIPGQLERYRAANARGRAGHQRPLPFEFVLSDRRHRCSFVVSRGEQRATVRGFSP